MFGRIEPVPATLLASELASLIPSRELRTLERMGTSVRFAEGRNAIRQREIGRECMVVLDGSFVVERDGLRIASLHPGDFMGEIALLTRQPRNATIIAAENSTAYVFSRREFVSLLRLCPTLEAHIRSIAADRGVLAA